MAFELGLDVLDTLDCIVLCLIVMNGAMIYIVFWIIVVEKEKKVLVV